MWRRPWTYREGSALAAGLLVVGTMLQLSVGPIYWQLFAWPVNIIVLAAFALAMLTIYALRRKAYALRFFTTVQAAVPALAVAAGLTVVMGLTRQYTGKPTAGQTTLDPLGLTRMLSAWPFVLVYLYMTVIVAQVTIRQTMHLRWRVIPSLVCHVGLLVVLLCGTLGSADMRRLKMVCEARRPEWRAADERGNIVELPLAIEMKRFILEEYPSEMTGEPDTTGIERVRRDPKRFASDIQIFTKSGLNIKATVDVNKPVTVEGWKIYQYGYDQAKGAHTDISIFELVSDPWIPAVYVGIYLLLAGAVALFLIPQPGKEGAS